MWISPSLGPAAFARQDLPGIGQQDRHNKPYQTVSGTWIGRRKEVVTRNDVYLPDASPIKLSIFIAAL
jgi:hypothetical protein